MRRKGQSVNIDWSTGLALFLVTILSSVVFLIDPISMQGQKSLDNQVMALQEDIQRDGGRTTRRNTFYIQSPRAIENVPFDRTYHYKLRSGHGVASEHSYLNISEDQFSSVLNTGNSSMDIIYFEGNFDREDRYSDLETSSGEITNSRIALQYTSNIESGSINGREAIQKIEISGDKGVSENDIRVEEFSGNLKVFNGSSEFIVEDDSFEITTKNYSTLYWHPEGNQSLTGTGTIEEGNTRGLSIADSDLGVTFMGDLYANVSKPDSSTVKVKIDAPRTRIRLHESGTGYGEKRIEAFAGRNSFFGVERVRSSFFRSELESLSNLTEREFETRYGLIDTGYNVTVEKEGGNEMLLNRGQQIAFRDTSTSTRQNSFISDSGDIQQAEVRVVMWR